MKPRLNRSAADQLPVLPGHGDHFSYFRFRFEYGPDAKNYLVYLSIIRNKLVKNNRQNEVFKLGHGGQFRISLRFEVQVINFS